MAIGLSSYKGFAGSGLRFATQVDLPCGYHKYRADLVIYNRCGRMVCVVECDGAAYHRDRVRDALRSRLIYKYYGVHTARFSGRAIYRDLEGCVEALWWFIYYGKRIPRLYSDLSY
jgi:very-short-patch-repair endonuclease